MKKHIIILFVLIMSMNICLGTDEITFRRITGLDYFITIRDTSDYDIWFPSAFEVWGTGAHDLSDYGIAAVEDFSNGLFAADMPAGINTGKRLLIEVYEQAGASPANGDDFTGSFSMVWNGSAEEFVTDTLGRTDNGYWIGTAVTLDTGKPDVTATVLNLAAPVPADVVSFSGSTTAADNLELDYDGTGFAKANSTIGTVTDVTNQVSADMTAVSGDSVAADSRCSASTESDRLSCS